ncbi:neuroblast differentiation-associated protein AHNAK-like [Sinocyclocheilus rhinocerous]|uniref:neuroblast differentiation-associated protein AHNAK-like n=1 Tax=Sinocyclocheilus rhinocerous TaxID=307959 RepID=UPI0007BA0754|nr:PREDICTED: neuroblast differentiation-associated protein AHNAK-like [Sinocyclocheilus rhinocerous]
MGKIQDVKLTVPTVNVHGGALDADLNLTEQKGVKGIIEIPGFNVRGQKGETASGLDMKPDASLSGVMEYQDVNVTFPKIKVPKFGVALPKVGGGEMGVDVGSCELAAGSKVTSQSLEIENTDMKSSGGKVKVKMPKLFVKSKSKGGSAADLIVEGEGVDVTSKGGAKVSKELSLSSGELTSGKLTVEGSSGFKVSPKSKSASLDLFKKTHHSSSVSDEGGLASPVSAEGHLQAEGGNVSVDVGEKVKGKKGKLKFATIGGFSSKSKGSYEVTDESEVRIEGAGGVAQSSKKSRMSSSSSSDSGSKSSFRLPHLEIAVSPKK